jgi:hypothetical protein
MPQVAFNSQIKPPVDKARIAMRLGSGLPLRTMFLAFVSGGMAFGGTFDEREQLMNETPITVEFDTRTTSSHDRKDHALGRKLMFESCFRSVAVSFHFWLCNASSANVRWSSFRAAWTISVSSKSLMFRTIGT